MQELNAVPEFVVKLLAQPRMVALVFALLGAAIIDFRTRRIPNWLTVGGMTLALVYSVAFPMPGQADFLGSVAGLAAGLIALLPLYVLRVMGAGDVKLMAMAGAFVGVPGILYAVLYTLVASGIATVGFAVYRRAFRRMSVNIAQIVQNVAFSAMAGHRPEPAAAGFNSIGKLPFAVSIAAGTIAWLVTGLLGYA